MFALIEHGVARVDEMEVAGLEACFFEQFALCALLKTLTEIQVAPRQRPRATASAADPA